MSTPEQPSWRWETVTDPRVRALIAVFGHDLERLGSVEFLGDYVQSTPNRNPAETMDFAMQHSQHPSTLADALVVDIGNSVLRHMTIPPEDVPYGPFDADPVDPYVDVIYQVAGLAGTDRAYGEADVAISILRGRSPHQAYAFLSSLSYLALEHRANG